MGSRPLAANAHRCTMGSRTLGATRAELALGGRLLGTLGFTLSNTRRAIMFKSLIVMALAAMTLAACVVYPAHPAYYREPTVVVY
jgi:hypothetical protein